MIGKISSGPVIETVPRGSGKAMFFNVQFGENDVRSAQFMPGSGIDSALCKDDVVICTYYGSALFITAAQSVKEPEAKAGERHIYIRDDSGAIVTELHFTDDGKINIKTTSTGIIEIGENKIEATDTSLILNGNFEVLQ
ncbi:MAG: hypothetical protein LBD20_02630 [Spirochaetaceae bacterium]|jgi:hypothetical protein|nr:hypothetical protein [Spirochaetaceae bacterium]